MANMDNYMYDHLDTLEHSRTNWRIKVRVTRMWPTTSPENGSVKGFNLILLDDDNSHIHAYVYPDNWHAIGNDVTEGDVYSIENFQVRDTVGKLKPVSTNIAIRFLSSTFIKRVKDDGMIPKHKFEFMDLGDLKEETARYVDNEVPEFAIDVIGVIDDYENLKRIQTKFGERDIVRFMLTDGSSSHKVSVWGDLAVAVHDSYYNQTEKPVVAVVTSTKLTDFRQTVQIGTLPSSKIYLNMNLEAVTELRDRLRKEGFKTSSDFAKLPKVPSVVPSVEKLTLKELNDNSTTYYFKKKVFCDLTILKIEDTENWWYYGCQKCHEQIPKQEKRYKCDLCKRNWTWAEKRFRLVVLAQDLSLTSNIILMDRVGRRFAGNTAAHYLNVEDKEPEDVPMPEVLNEIVGKNVTVMITLTEANVKGDSNLFEATDLCDSSDVTSSSNAEYSPIPNCPSFDHANAVEGVVLFETPSSANSVTKKIKIEP